MTTFWTQAFSVWMQSFDSRLHNADILAFIHDVHEIRPVRVQTPDTTEITAFIPVCNGNE